MFKCQIYVFFIKHLFLNVKFYHISAFQEAEILE